MRRTILVVGPDRLVRTQVHDILERRGDLVLSARNGYQCLALLDGVLPDLVLVDSARSDTSGLQLCAHLRSRSPNLPVGLLVRSLDARYRGLQLLLKPFDEPALIAFVQALERRAAAATGAEADAPDVAAAAPQAAAFSLSASSIAVSA